MPDVTNILAKIEDGDPNAADKLLPLVYNELRKLAAARLASEKPGQTLQATALVHDAFIRLVDVDQQQKWNSRGHFFSAAAEAMRRILVESARRKAGPTAGGQMQRDELDDIVLSNQPSAEILAVNEALDRLAAKDARKAEIIKLRFFAGMTNEEAAQALGISARTAYEDWRYAKTWLRVEVAEAN